ncbi:MAG: diguanylate cyclase [Alphaproteobacteria bacterium]|nr:diguanylate cyclase [Rhodospirillales bacterium]MCW9045538.1 diguanylate cyclase [Alphaproteobacteria bacterium]
MATEEDKNNNVLQLTREGLNHLDQGICVFDQNLSLVSTNKRVAELLEFPPDLFQIGEHLETMLRFNAERGEYGPGDVEEQIQERIEQALKFEPHAFERVRPDGTILDIRGTPLPSGGFVSTFADITKQRKAEDDLKASSERNQAVLEASPLGVSITRYEDSIIIYANEALGKMHGVPTRQLIGTEASSHYLHVEEREEIVEQLKKGQAVTDYEAQLKAVSGRIFWAQLNMAPTLVDAEPVILTWVRDSTESHIAKEHLEHMALHDSLTGLANGRRFNDFTQEAVARSRRRKKKGALLYFDLDGFKQVNDTMGHQFGDFLLQEVASRLKTTLRETDLIARLGGDEFGVVIEDLSEDLRPERVAEKILNELEKPYKKEESTASVSASIGIAYFGDEEITIDNLIKRADSAMYRAKNSGKGRTCLYDPKLDD